MLADCSNTSEGFTPIPDMSAVETYTRLGESSTGRLYLDAGTPTNTIPAAHAAVLATKKGEVVKRDASGSPAPAGKIVVLSIGMSNAKEKFAQFKRNAADRNPAVLLVNGAQTAQVASVWADPDDAVWTNAASYITAAGGDVDQVQVVWIEQTEADPSGGFHAFRDELKGYLKSIVQNCQSKYPNLKLIFFSTRTYGGYATTGNPEPYAYETGFAVRALIDDQISGADTDLDTATFPPMAWATYLDGAQWKGAYWWSDGTTANTEGLVSNCADYEADGLHPAGDDDGVSAPDGMEHKCAARLLEFFQNSPYTAPWWTPPLTPTLLDSTSSNVSATSFASGAFTPTAGTLLLVLYESRAGAVPNQPTCSGHSLTWVHKIRRLFATEASPRAQVGAFWAVAGSSPGSAAVTLDFSGQSQAVCNIVVIECPNIYAAAGGIVQSVDNSADSVDPGPLQINLAAETTEALMIAAFANIIGASMTPKSGWVELVEAEPAGSPLGLLQIQYIDEYDSPAEGLRSGSGAMHIGGIVLGLRRPPPNYLLEVTVAGRGTVTSDPAGIACGGDCDEEFVEDTVVVLDARPKNNWVFDRWIGDFDSRSGTQAVVTMDAAKQTTAVFKYPLGTSIRGVVGDRSGRVIAEITPEWLPISWRLNDVGQANFVIAANDDKATEEILRYGNRVYVEFSNGLPPWGGVIDLPRGWTEDGRTAVSVYSGEYLLGWRRTPREQSFVGMTAGEIFQALIQGANALEDLGIALGDVWAGGGEYTLDLHYADVLSVIRDELCEKMTTAEFALLPVLEDGRITFLAEFYEQRGTEKPNVVLIEGHNLSGDSLAEYGPIVNDWALAGSGSGWGEDRLTSEGGSSNLDPDSISRHGLRQDAAVFGSITVQSTLDAQAATLLAASKEPIKLTSGYAVNRAPAKYADYDLGDRIRVMLHSKGFRGTDATIRVTTREFDPATGLCNLVPEQETA